MELDVHLTRGGAEPWGLELEGGRDLGSPLTIGQVDMCSPAHAAGLQPGDTVTRVGDRLSSELSQHAARTQLAEAVGSLSFGVCRGLYDPVVDDFESIYEPIDRADFDLQSEPTEVSPPRCIDLPELPLSDLNDFCPITESRSLTASPFCPQTKPYRPFSTEPLNVPPLEDPIILNPKFKNDFAEILDGIDIDKVETKYKLPVSEQYDQNYRKKIDGILEKSMERELLVNGNKTDTIQIRIDEVSDIKEHKDAMQLKNEAVMFEEETEFEIDIKNIERTALDIVEQSIERAVSVTEEIKEAVEEELRASVTRDIGHIKNEIKTEEFNERKESELSSSEVIQSEITDKEFEEAEVKVNLFESSERVTEKPPKDLLYTRENKKKTKTYEVKTEISDFVKKDYEDTTRKEYSECKQNVFNLGLQTIPNIKGMAQSSYHFDLLMRTFFIHLTDVMVALSRFILTQPALELEMKAERLIKEKLITGLGREETITCDVKSQECHKSQHSRGMQKNIEVKHELNARDEIKKADIQKRQEIKRLSEFKEHRDMEFEEMEKKMLSGAQMSQMTQRKPNELTHRMDAVISEFETKTGIEDRLEVTDRRRRSRSRSRIEEEVMSESDPLDWLANVDSIQSSQDKTNISTSKKTSSSHTESKERRRTEHESKEVRTSKTKPGKQMYVAVVEAHVYTNKDAILEEMLETSSIESTEEMNTSVEMKSVEKQQAVEVITQALEDSNVIVAESIIASSESKHEYLHFKESRVEKAEEKFKTAAVETTEVNSEVSKEFTEKTVSKQEAVEDKHESLTTVASETTETVADLRAKSFNIFEMSEQMAVIASEENYKATAEHSTETLLEETREAPIKIKANEKHATSQTMQLAIAVAESIDIVIDDNVEILKADQLKTKTAVVRAEESFKTAAIESTDVVLEEAVEQHAVALEMGHATIRETKNLAVAGIIETKIEEDKVIIPKPAEDEYASLKIIKQEVIDDESVDITEIFETEVINKSIEIENYVSHEKSSTQSKKLHLRTDIAQQREMVESNDSDIDTPTPSTLPPTPLTDEYVFKLQIPMPKNTGLIIKEDSPDHEDLSIVKKRLVAHIETTIDEQIIYDPPLPTPIEDKLEPVYTKLVMNGGGKIQREYTKPGLKGGASVPYHKKEYIREIERKSSLLASAIDQTIRSIEEYREEVGDRVEAIPEVELITHGDGLGPEDELRGFRAVPFEPEGLPKQNTPVNVPVMPERRTPQPYLNESGEPLGTAQGIIYGLEDATVDEEVAKELGKPGLTGVKVAELISGESDMMREAHLMGLTRVLSTHMHKPDDCSEDLDMIKPLLASLKHSEVIAALNEEVLKSKEEEKKREEKKWTKFLQKPQRPAPRAKCGYHGYLPQEEHEEGPYKVKIVKQPKPKVAPDYKPEDFETGPLPWEERALTEPPPPPVALEDPILVPEENPQFLEAVDPLPESQVPDLQDTGIVLPAPQPDIPVSIQEPQETPPVEEVTEKEEETEEEVGEEKKEEEMKGEVEEMAEQLVQNVKSMVDPHAPIHQQLAQMRAQLAALAQLPCVIQQSLEILTSHLAHISQQECHQVSCKSQKKTEGIEEVEQRACESDAVPEDNSENEVGHVTVEEIGAPDLSEEALPEAKITLTAQEYAALQREEEMMLEEQMKSDKLKKVQEKMEQESRQIKQRAAPRVGKPKPVFGPQNPEVRPLVLPGGRRWKGPKDVFDEQFIAETLQAQSEMIQGKVMGINFMKYEKPPVSLDHLQHSAVYRAVHEGAGAGRRVDLLTPVVAEADYRERCRAMTPAQGQAPQLQP